MIVEISLHGIEFFAYHGFYAEERKIGNKYGIDVTFTAEVGDSPLNDDLSQTIDYESVYQIIKKVIETPTKLLEAIANRILDAMFLEFPQVQKVEVTVSKFNPPVGGICQKASAKMLKVKKNI
ncbi:MAG: dihydroneopterin aldolase [Bacteroidota bacterium]|nr:dihydroneopterin aldolase [Bacteroidota bacterium]